MLAVRDFIAPVLPFPLGPAALVLERNEGEVTVGAISNGNQ